MSAALHRMTKATHQTSVEAVRVAEVAVSTTRWTRAKAAARAAARHTCSWCSRGSARSVSAGVPAANATDARALATRRHVSCPGGVRLLVILMLTGCLADKLLLWPQKSRPTP